MSAYLRGIDRNQPHLLPESLEDYVSPKSIVRFIDAFVEGLSSAETDASSLPAEREMTASGGAPGFSPKTHAKLLIWGYLKRVRSTRALEEAARLNLEVIWLLQKLAPDHSSISRFRKNNRKRILSWLKQFNLVCAKLDLFGGEELSVDGVFLKAVNSKANNYTQGQLLKRLERLDEQVEEFLRQLEQSELEEQGPALAGKLEALSAEQLLERLQELDAARSHALSMLEAAKDSPTGQLSTTDEDSRLLKKKSAPGSAMVGYLAESAVDAKHHLIAAAEVTLEANDFGQLSVMAEAAGELVPPPPAGQARRVMGDGGFFELNDLKRCEDCGYEPWVPAYPQRKAAVEAGLFPTSAFAYDSEADACRCPEGHLLERHASYTKDRSLYHTYYNSAACRECPARSRCTKGAYRKIHRHQHQDVVERMRQRMKAEPERYRNRAASVEHPFGSMMFYNEGRNLLCRGLDAARAEFALSALAYNIKRAVKLVGIEALIAAVLGPRANLCRFFARSGQFGRPWSLRSLSIHIGLGKPI